MGRATERESFARFDRHRPDTDHRSASTGRQSSRSGTSHERTGAQRRCRASGAQGRLRPTPERSGGGGMSPPDAVADLLRRLTTAEKIALLHQRQPAVPRLGLAAFHTGCEALHGVAWLGRATVFPQAVGLGASWDRALLRAVGEAVSTEVRALHRDGRASLNVWAPVVNPLRDPRWGRNEEGYSEDPLMTAELAVAYCTGLRGGHPDVWRTAPVLKHFLAYNVETARDVVDIAVPERVLHEYELPGFLEPLRAGVAAGVMPAYNLVNGVPNHVHPLIADVLRAVAPDLVVCSDAQAPSNLVDTERYFPDHAAAHAAALRAGVDSYTDNGPDPAPTIARFTEALRRGLITEADLDTALGRILLLRARTGEFEPARDPYTGIRDDVIGCEAHTRLAARAAHAGVVLLKNAAGALPWTGTGGVAVIGHLGDRVLTDWYSGTPPYTVSVADALRARLGWRSVTTVDGVDRIRLATPDGRQVLLDPDGTLRLGDAPGAMFAHQQWGTSVPCPVPVHTLREHSTDRYVTVEESGVLAATAVTPDGWVVRELGAAPRRRRGVPAALQRAGPVRDRVRRRAADRRRRRCAAAHAPRGDLRGGLGGGGRPGRGAGRAGAGQRPAHQRPGDRRPGRAAAAAGAGDAAARGPRRGAGHGRHAGVQLPVCDRLGAGARTGDPVEQPRRAGARQRPRRRAARRGEPGRTAAADLVSRRHRAARAHRLRHHRLRLDVPVPPRRAALPVRPRAVVHDVRLRPAGRDGHRHRVHRVRDGHQHGRPRRRRGRPAVRDPGAGRCRRRPGGWSASSGCPWPRARRARSASTCR
ncbi:hypothetical protein GCM10027610_049570 [Dactylosporangium cerinum]